MLGAGGLLLVAFRLTRLVQQGHEALQPILARVLADTPASVEAAAATLRGPAEHRLAFRELGLALGLHAAPALQAFPSALGMARFIPLAAEIESFWLDSINQGAATWRDHRDINAIMLAASLAPAGVLG